MVWEPTLSAGIVVATVVASAHTRAAGIVAATVVGSAHTRAAGIVAAAVMDVHIAALTDFAAIQGLRRCIKQCTSPGLVAYPSFLFGLK